MIDTPCTSKKKHRTEEEQRLLINRLSRIEGQVRGIKKMLEQDAYCIDIITQASAVSSAMTSFSRELLLKHIETCVATGLKNGDPEIISELTDVLNKILK